MLRKNLKTGRSGSERYFQFDQAKCTPKSIEIRKARLKNRAFYI